MKKLVPIILCGGNGSRLWPLSRVSFPKQYLKINNQDELSFFQKTLQRIKEIKNIEDPIIVCNEEHRFIVAEQLRSIGIKAKSILLEPVSRNTAPAITVAAIKALEEDKNSNLLVLPADHLIKNKNEFERVISEGVIQSDLGKLILFGIIPSKAEIGFGYIEADKVLNSKKLCAQKIIKFIEKPNRKLAEKLIMDKKCTWNSGIFIFKASIYIDQIKKREPDIFKYCFESLSNKNFDLDFQRIDKNPFSLCKNISIDKAVMEKTNLGLVIPLKAGWSDMGSWESMWEVSDKDDSGNVLSGNIMTNNVIDSYIRSEDRLIVTIGLENLVIVDTSDALLIVKKNQSQKVKDIVEELSLKNIPQGSIHKTIYRPWGNYKSIANGSNWQVKKIIVNSNESLSLQMHNHRAEHWIIVSGTALVEINNVKKLLKENESVYIPIGAKHRLSNPGEELLTLIEVQSGNYFGEDDIIRFSDKYGRLK